MVIPFDQERLARGLYWTAAWSLVELNSGGDVARWVSVVLGHAESDTESWGRTGPPRYGGEREPWERTPTAMETNA